MMILEALTFGETTLRSAFEQAPAYHQPKIDAQLLLSHCIEQPTAYLFSHFGEELTSEQEEAYSKVIERRASMEPVAYITGKKAFFGRDFNVNEHTLIPRPDTELMVEEALKLISTDDLVADIGTGSGAIAITTALELNHPVLAVDISKEAIAAARANAENLEASELVHFLHGNLLEPLFTEGENYSKNSAFIVLANLPYISTAFYDLLDRGVKDFEPKSALISGEDGLDHYRELFDQLARFNSKLPKKKAILCEIDSSQRRSIIDLGKARGATRFEIKKDLERRDRLAIFYFD